MNTVNTVIDAWREQMQAFDRYMAELRGDEHGHGGHGRHGGHGSGPQRFSYTNKPLDPYRTDDPVVNALFDILGADAKILDVGGGSGRLALPLATRAKRVTVVEPSEDSVELLNERAAEAGITNITVINESWEDVREPTADIVLCSLVLHHVPDAAALRNEIAATCQRPRSGSRDDGDARCGRSPILRARAWLRARAIAGNPENPRTAVGAAHLP